MELADELRCEPLALAQAASVVASSTLACRDYRDYFARTRQQMGADPDEVPAAEVTWTLSLGQAESLLPGMPVRLEPATGDVRIEGVLVECGADGRATSCTLVRVNVD